MTIDPAPAGHTPCGQTIWRRLLGRLRYGLLVQELLDRLVRHRLIVYPYFVVQEPGSEVPAAAPDERTSFRFLGVDDADEVARVLAMRISRPLFLELLTRAECLGVFFDGKLAGYTWARLDTVPVPEGLGHPVFDLQPDEAYLFDMYVTPAHRGSRLAGSLRQAMQRELAFRGRTCFYSLTLAFNRASRRFKSRLGAREVELRLHLRLSVASLPGLDIRLWRRSGAPRSLWLRRLPSTARTAPRA
jgi:ribosomal protein S18 acetylase RimI-like enzyme